MIRCCKRLISQSYSRYNSLCILLKRDCVAQKPSEVFPFGNNLCFSNHLSSLVMPPLKEKVALPSDISMNPQVTSIIESVQHFGFEDNEVRTLLQNNPELIKTSSTLWHNIVGVLIESGFEKSNVLSILEKWPKVLFLNKYDLIKNLQAWFGCGFGQDLLFLVLTTHPSFLQVDHGHVSKRIKQYQLHFESKKRVGKMLLSAPNALEEHWNVLSDKLNYLDELCTDKSDISSSGVLAHSVLHIKARHEFLIRAGVYKRPNKDFHKRLSKNPKLERIVNTTDEEFVSNVARLSLFEYEVFLEIFERELALGDVNDSDSDDDALSYKKQYVNKKKNLRE